MEFETLAVQGFIDLKKQNNSVSMPIYANTAYSFDSVQYAVDLFDLKTAGDIYSRLTNPSNEMIEKRIAALEGGVGALAASSGMSAILIAILNLAGAGDEVVTSSKIYGGTYNLFSKTLKQVGINVNFINSDNLEDYENAINNKTKCLFIETIGNPRIKVADIEGLANLAHKYGIPLIVDNTVATPYLCRPIEFGADIIVHSTTKYLSGHGNAMGGIIVDSGKFDWSQNDKFKMFTTPDESYHGIIYTEAFGNAAFIAKARAHLIRDLGCSQSPFNAYLTQLGLETLHVRMERHCENALKLAKHLESHPNINYVIYPYLESSPDYEAAKKYLKKGASSLIGFGVDGDGTKFIEALKLFIHATNLGDVRSIITYPAGTTHRQLSDKQLLEAGITNDFMRASIGLENIDDIIQDIDNAIKISRL
ncbi:MAG: O-acetylhomoserine aminocarboxypropyltransferase/cysteine synthase [Candidatus Gastranaerophilales bacterium]|nr:O-acetylhomoserine aminocarboxypropyltransferase/cysteine synthase [Candidatus Gastranaerophilales bacterium]